MNLIKYLESQSYNVGFIKLFAELVEKYPEELFNLSGIGWQLDYNKMSKQFFLDRSIDASVDANANAADKSVIAHRIETSKPFQLINSYYRLWKGLCKSSDVQYANSIIENQLTGQIYINDFAGFSSSMPYCYNYSTYDTALNGIPPELDGRGGSKPPKHLEAFLGQILLFALIAGNSTLGATGLADLFIVISIYMDKIVKTGKDSDVRLAWCCIDDIDIRDEYNEVNYWQYLESKLTRFIYELNQPYRGSQSLFTNVSVMDDYFLQELIPHYKLEIDDIVYEARLETVKKVQETYLRIMNKELRRKPLTFPVTSVCFSVHDEDGAPKIKDRDFLDLAVSYNIDFAYQNIYAGKLSTLSSCCRLRSDLINEYFNSFGAGSTKIGSLGVCTGNLVNLAFRVTKETNDLHTARSLFKSKLEDLVYKAQEVNQAKRVIIQRTIDNGNHPLYTLGYIDINTQYNTFGVVGAYEALEILGLSLLSKQGQEFFREVMEVINNTNRAVSDSLGIPCNCEQIPAENVAVNLAKKDKLLGCNIDYDLYSNQFIPLWVNVDLLDRVSIQGDFDKYFDGGSITHLNLDQKITNSNILKNLIEHIISKGVVYFAFNYVLNVCKNGHNSVGNIDRCPICGQDIIDLYTRVVGFLSKIKNWNKVRREIEFPKRVFYRDDSICE